jgi:uncharacterized damage-inducible protein DinB
MADAIREAMVVALSGKNAHVVHMVALEAVSATQARKRPKRGVATIWEQLAHMVFWQDIMVMRMQGEVPPPVPHDADGWPKMPPVKGQEQAWAAPVEKFAAGLKEAEKYAKKANLTAKMPKVKRTYADQILSLATHNSYHTGQIITVRRMLGLWPPPSGGDTW